MPTFAPGYVPGYDTVLSQHRVSDTEIPAIRDALRSPSNGRFFSMFPASTPKYAQNLGPRPSERTESMARFYIYGQGPTVQDRSLAASIGNLYSAGITVSENGERTRYGGETSGSGFGYFDFILSAWSINYQEREQAVDTISDNTVIFYSGMTAPVGQGSGALLNTYQDDQNVWFHYAYMESLRGSRLAARGQIASLVCDSFRYDGYLSNLQIQTQAQVQNAVMFSFTFRVKRINVVTPLLYSASAIADLWTARQEPLVVTAPVTEDSTTRVGAQLAVNPVSPTNQPAAVAAAEAGTRDARATPESATAPPSEAGRASANQIALEAIASELASMDTIMYGALNLAEGTGTLGDIAPSALPADTAPNTVRSPTEQLVASIAGTRDVTYGLGTVVPRDPTSGRFLASTGGMPAVIDVAGAVTVSAGASADKIAAAAQGDTLLGPVYGQSSTAAPSTLPAYAQGGSNLPGGFTDIYRVQGTVFAEAYARAAAEVAAVRTAGALTKDAVGRRSRRRRGSSLVAA